MSHPGHDPVRINAQASLGAGLDLPPGLSFDEWLAATGLDFNTGVLGNVGGSLPNLDALSVGYQAYRALSGEFGAPGAPPEAPELSLRIDKERTGAGDLRIRRDQPQDRLGAVR